MNDQQAAYTVRLCFLCLFLGAIIGFPNGFYMGYTWVKSKPKNNNLPTWEIWPNHANFQPDTTIFMENRMPTYPIGENVYIGFNEVGFGYENHEVYIYPVILHSQILATGD